MPNPYIFRNSNDEFQPRSFRVQINVSLLAAPLQF